MKLPRRNFLHLAAGAAALSAVSRFARAQAYPTRPVKIVVPVGPSGSYDIVGRALTDQLAKRLDQTVVVENRAGAGTVVGTQAVIQSPADGYTLLVGGLSNIVFNVGLYKNPPYDPLKDLVPVALVFNISYTLIGSKASPYASPKEIVASSRESVEAGGLMSYEPSLTDAHRQIASMLAASSRMPSRHFSRLVTVGAMVAWKQPRLFSRLI